MNEAWYVVPAQQVLRDATEPGEAPATTGEAPALLVLLPDASFEDDRARSDRRRRRE